MLNDIGGLTLNHNVAAFPNCKKDTGYKRHFAEGAFIQNYFILCSYSFS